MMFEYRINVLRVVDGDTVDARVDLGFKVHHNIRIRFHGINAPESRTRDLEEKARGLAAKARVKELIAEAEKDGKVILQSHGVGKFGRCLGSLRIELDNDEEYDLVERLLEEGHGVPYFGGKR